MSRTIYFTAATINGLIADEQGSLEWLTTIEPSATTDDPATGDAKDEPPAHVAFMEQIGVLVEGSTTYQWCLDHGETDFTGGRFPTFVFTSRSLPAAAGADVRFRSGNVRDSFDEIRAAADGKDIWLVGGGDLAGQFYDAGLLDELQISIAPGRTNGWCTTASSKHRQKHSEPPRGQPVRSFRTPDLPRHAMSRP